MNVITKVLSEYLEPLGFDAHAFKVGWYNDHVSPSFRLPYDYNTLAFVVISKPEMFEKCFKEFICLQTDTNSLQDPVDQCMIYYFTKLQQLFPSDKIETIYDFELLPNRRPKVLMQTVGHVSGSAYYYQRSDVKNDPWDEKQKIFGVCLHPQYGGWFGLRSVLIYTEIEVPELPEKKPIDVLPRDEDRVELLERLNFHWQDWSFRDMIPVKEKYSEEQKQYFDTKPNQRWSIIEKWKKEWTQNREQENNSV